MNAISGWAIILWPILALGMAVMTLYIIAILAISIGMIAAIALCIVFAKFTVLPTLRAAKQGFFKRPGLVRAATAAFAVFAVVMILSPILLIFEAPALLCMVVTLVGTIAGIIAGYAFVVFASYLQCAKQIAKPNLAIAASVSIVLAAVLGGSMVFLWALAMMAV